MNLLFLLRWSKEIKEVLSSNLSKILLINTIAREVANIFLFIFGQDRLVKMLYFNLKISIKLFNSNVRLTSIKKKRKLVKKKLWRKKLWKNQSRKKLQLLNKTKKKKWLNNRLNKKK